MRIGHKIGHDSNVDNQIGQLTSKKCSFETPPRQRALAKARTARPVRAHQRTLGPLRGRSIRAVRQSCA